MKRNTLSKLLGSIAMIFVLLAVVPTQARAGGWGAEIRVIYGELDEAGNFRQMNQDNRNLVDTIREPSGKTGRTSKGMCGSWDSRYMVPCYEVGFEEQAPQLGTYALTDIQYPAGYELDDAMGDKYPLSYTVTQAVIDKYMESYYTEAGHDDYDIYVPVKKIGTQSSALSKPIKAELAAWDDNGGIRVTNNANGCPVEYQYSSKKNSGYKTLAVSSDSYVNFRAYSAVTHGESYYFRARYVKNAGGQEIAGAFSDPVKVKVSKVIIESRKPSLRVITLSGKAYSLNGETYRDSEYGAASRVYYYATSKKGTYKKLVTHKTSKVLKVSSLSKLKKGKTYYVKMRWEIKVDGKTVRSKYSNVVKVKR